MKLDNLRGLETMCFDADIYGVSDATRHVAARELFRAASAPEKREMARQYEQIAAEMQQDAAKTEALLTASYGPQMEADVGLMAGKLMFFDSPDLRRRWADYLAAVKPYERGMESVTRLFSESAAYRSQASELRWSARKDEFTGFVHKLGDGLKAWLHLT